MKRANQALAFIKPHAARNKAALDCIASTFARNGIRTLYAAELTGPQVAASGAIDRHYAVNARVGTIANAADLFVGPEARAKFLDLFKLSWDDALRQGRILSGLSAQKKLGLTGEAFNTLWARQKAQKLAGGLYVILLPELDAFVLNGFYPSIRDLFTAPDALLKLMVVEFDPATLPWRAFRGQVIGITNPAAADPRSIRGALHAAGKETGLAVTYRENIIHASASPFEAIIEKTLWSPDFPLDRDPLWQALKPAGVPLDKLLRWRDENPVVPNNGKQEPLVESLEDLDTDAAAARLLELIKTGAL
jgi:nucleoside diphosphate kinase